MIQCRYCGRPCCCHANDPCVCLEVCYECDVKPEYYDDDELDYEIENDTDDDYDDGGES